MKKNRGVASHPLWGGSATPLFFFFIELTGGGSATPLGHGGGSATPRSAGLRVAEPPPWPKGWPATPLFIFFFFHRVMA
jgi:hypothetical protein